MSLFGDGQTTILNGFAPLPYLGKSGALDHDPQYTFAGTCLQDGRYRRCGDQDDGQLHFGGNFFKAGITGETFYFSVIGIDRIDRTRVSVKQVLDDQIAFPAVAGTNYRNGGRLAPTTAMEAG
jgi:hypothetical protein